MIRATDDKIVIESLSAYQAELIDEPPPSDGYRGEGSNITVAIENFLSTIAAAGKQCPNCGKSHSDNMTEGICQHCGFILVSGDDK